MGEEPCPHLSARAKYERIFFHERFAAVYKAYQKMFCSFEAAEATHAHNIPQPYWLIGLCRSLKLPSYANSK